MKQYEVLYAVKDENKENMLFADVGEAPHPWKGWSLESIKVCAHNIGDVQKAFYRKVEAVDGRECVFVNAKFIRQLQYVHRLVVAVQVNPNPNGWRVRTISVRTNSEASDLCVIWDLALLELKKRYPGVTSDNCVFLDRVKAVPENEVDLRYED